MKNEGMRKHSNEEKGGFKHVKFLISIILFFTYSQLLIAQINLNGFGVLNKYPSFKNKNKLFALDYNQDSFIDLVTFGSANERVTLHPGSGNKFNKAIDKFFYYLISDIKLFNNIEDLGQHYIFISRKEELAGLVSFTKYGTLTLLNTLKFNSYPSSICTGDINNDGILEAIVAGKNFNGMSVLKQDRFKLFETRLLTNRIFSEVNLIDLDFDKYPEIIAFDELDNSIIILANDQDEGFRDERKVKVNSKVNNLILEDFNRDGFIDILFSTNREVQILEGDSVSSFENRRTLFTNIFHDKFLFADINNDGLKDFIFLTKESGDLQAAISNKDRSFSVPFIIYNNLNLTDIIFFRQMGIKSIGMIDNEGNLYTIQNKPIVSPANIPAGYSPTILGAVPSIKSKSYLYYLDDKRQTFVMLEIDNANKISKYFSHKFTSTYAEIKFYRTGKNELQFLLFNKKNIFFDELIFSTSGNQYSSRRTFTKQPILDVDFHASAKPGIADKYSALTLSNGNLSIENYNTNNSDQLIFTQFIDSNSVTGLVKAGDIDTLYYWTNKDSAYQLIRASQFSSDFIADILLEKNMDISESEFPKSVWLDHKNNFQLHNFNNRSSDSFFLIEGEIYDASLFLPAASINPDNIKVSFEKREKKYSIWVCDNNKLNQFQLDDAKPKVKLINSIDYLECKDYFVSYFSNNLKYLIYTNSSDNFLTLQKIE